MTRLRLALLARDEAARLPGLAAALDGVELDSVRVAIDDRTSDDTAEVAEQLWAHLPGEGGIQLIHFDDFGQARNLALDYAREGLDPDDYLLFLDPDSPPDGELPAIDELTADAYTCTWAWGGEEYPRAILVRVGAEARFEGAVHENLWCAGRTDHLTSVRVAAGVTAGPERLTWMEGVLRRDAATNPRSAYYLAQTLMDLGRTDEAFGWFLRRAAMGHGWDEETYLATYMAGVLIEPLDWLYAEVLWRRAMTIRPRTEPIWQLARAANARGDHNEALALASLGLRMGRNVTDSLRVNRWIELEGLQQQFNLAATGCIGIPTPRLEPQHG